MRAEAIPTIKLLESKMKESFDAWKDELNGRKHYSGGPSSLQYGIRYFATIESIQPTNALVKATRIEYAKPTNMVTDYRMQCLKTLVAQAGTDVNERKKVLPLITGGFQEALSNKIHSHYRHGILFEYMELLGIYGKLSEGELPTLKKLKLSEDGAIREAATKAVEKIEADS
jgi:hypothetical protein